MTNLLIFFVFLSVVLLILFFVVVHLFSKKIKECNKLNEELEKQKSNVAYLVKHAEELAVIENGKTDLINQITGAKTDEEIADIVSTIINSNNSKL